jgi:hypothetical protein
VASLPLQIALNDDNFELKLGTHVFLTYADALAAAK